MQLSSFLGGGINSPITVTVNLESLILQHDYSTMTHGHIGPRGDPVRTTKTGSMFASDSFHGVFRLLLC